MLRQRLKLNTDSCCFTVQATVKLHKRAVHVIKGRHLTPIDNLPVVWVSLCLMLKSQWSWAHSEPHTFRCSKSFWGEIFPSFGLTTIYVNETLAKRIDTWCAIAHNTACGACKCWIMRFACVFHLPHGCDKSRGNKCLRAKRSHSDYQQAYRYPGWGTLSCWCQLVGVQRQMIA